MEFIEMWDKLDFTCYGSGESEFLGDLKKLAIYMNENDKREGYNPTYDYKELGDLYGHQSYAWCLINMFVHAEFMDFGTSIRYGWFTEEGKLFLQHIEKNAIEELYTEIMNS